MISAAAKAGRWRTALEHFQGFGASGGRPNTATYNALVRAHCLLLPVQACATCPSHGA